jgi:hypothetical protein
MILYYRLMTKWSGLGDSTELSRVGLSHKRARPALISPAGEEGDRAAPVSRTNLKHWKVGGLPTFRKVCMISVIETVRRRGTCAFGLRWATRPAC